MSPGAARAAPERSRPPPRPASRRGPRRDPAPAPGRAAPPRVAALRQQHAAVLQQPRLPEGVARPAQDPDRARRGLERAGPCPARPSTASRNTSERASSTPFSAAQARSISASAARIGPPWRGRRRAAAAPAPPVPRGRGARPCAPRRAGCGWPAGHPARSERSRARAALRPTPRRPRPPARARAPASPARPPGAGRPGRARAPRRRARGPLDWTPGRHVSTLPHRTPPVSCSGNSPTERTSTR